MKKVILRTLMSTKSNYFSDTLFRTHFFGRTFQGMDRDTSVGLFSKLTTKPTKPGKPTENQRIFDS
jgi:hypothetical protein